MHRTIVSNKLLRNHAGHFIKPLDVASVNGSQKTAGSSENYAKALIHFDINILQFLLLDIICNKILHLYRFLIGPVSNPMSIIVDFF